MENLQTLLRRIKDALGKDSFSKETVLSCVKDVSGVSLDLKDVLIKGDAIHIRTTPSRRSEIKLNEVRILDAIKNKTNLNLKRIYY